MMRLKNDEFKRYDESEVSLSLKFTCPHCKKAGENSLGNCVVTLNTLILSCPYCGKLIRIQI